MPAGLQPRICIIAWDYYLAASSVARGPEGGFPAGQCSILCMYKTACVGGMLCKKVIPVQLNVNGRDN